MTLRDAHRPAAPAELRNDQCQARELQERAILPSDFEDASLTEQSWPTIPAVTHVIEALGSEIHVIFVIDAPPVEHKDVADLGPQGEEDESGIPLYEGKSCGRRGSTRAAVSAPATGSTSGWIPATCTSSTPTAGSRSATSKQQSRDAENTASPRQAS
jgi:hypothetical protein